MMNYVKNFYYWATNIAEPKELTKYKTFNTTSNNKLIHNAILKPVFKDEFQIYKEKNKKYVSDTNFKQPENKIKEILE